MKKSHFLKEYAALIGWMIATVFCIFQFYVQVSASIMVSDWQKDFHLNAAQVSYLSSAFFYTYLPMQIVVGYLNDHFSARRIISCGTSLLALSCVILSTTHHFWIAWSARCLMGIGASFAFVSVLSITARSFRPEQFTVMFGLSEFLGMGCAGLLTLSSAVLFHCIVWRWTFLMSGIMAFGIGIAAHYMMREFKHPCDHTEKHLGLWPAIKIACSVPALWWMSLIGFLNYACVAAVESLWGVPFLMEEYRFPLEEATGIAMMMLYGTAIGMPLWAWISMRIRRRKPILILGGALTTVVLVWMIFIHSTVPTLSILFFLIGFFMSHYAQAFSIVNECVPERAHGVGMAILNMLLMLSAPIDQMLIGILIKTHIWSLVHDTHHVYQLALGIIPIGTLLSIGIACVVQETYCVRRQPPITC